jgi:hypothetical protein
MGLIFLALLVVAWMFSPPFAYGALAGVSVWKFLRTVE